MIISKIDFPIYGILILISIIIGILYIYKMIKKDDLYNKNLLLFFLLYIVSSLILGIQFTLLVSKGETIGLSSYGGLIGAILSAFIFEKILSFDNKLIKYVIISLPLVYSIGKIGCFIAGCCYGIPYDGLLSVKYPDRLNVSLFPIQIFETITFFIIFIICNKNKNNKNIIYITILLSTIAKFLLDFLRYDHVTKIITLNQIISIIIIVCTIIIYLFRKRIRFSNKGGI